MKLLKDMIVRKEITIYLKGEDMVEIAKAFVEKDTGVKLPIIIDYGDQEDEDNYYFMPLTEELTDEEFEKLDENGYDIYSIGEFTDTIFSEAFKASGVQSVYEFHSTDYSETVFPITYDEEGLVEFENTIKNK